MPGTDAPSTIFLAERAAVLARLHKDLLELMMTVRLADELIDGRRNTALAPQLDEQGVMDVLLAGYRSWCDSVRPFLERSPVAPTNAFVETQDLLSSYFSLRRVGVDIQHDTWRYLFRRESANLVERLLSILIASEDCFALLNPQPLRGMEQLTLRLEGSIGGECRVLAESNLGEAETTFTLPFDARDLENFTLRYCDPARGLVRSWVPATLAPYTQFGAALFDAVFIGRVRDLYLRHSAAREDNGTGLRIRLRLGNAPALATIPWEFLYDGVDFVVLRGGTTIIRYVEATHAPRTPVVTGPIRMLVTISSPTDVVDLDTRAEVRELERALAPLVAMGMIRLEFVPDGSLASLRRVLRAADNAGKPVHIWHFIGHGRYSEEDGASRLAFEDLTGAPHLVSGFELGTLFSSHESVRLAFLNACEGARSGPEDSVRSIGSALIQRGLPAVVAMQFGITDGAAICFASEFYSAIIDGTPIDAAVGEARRAVFFLPNASEWATAAVMTRTKDGVLFLRG